jgi:hypothetical protein
VVKGVPGHGCASLMLTLMFATLPETRDEPSTNVSRALFDRK